MAFITHTLYKSGKIGAVLIFLVCFVALSASAQCDYTASFAIKHSDCQDNGEITITLTGDALLGTTDAHRSYRVYLTGTPVGDRPAWSASNHWINLAPGDYTVETRVFCIADGINIDQHSTNHVIEQSYPWAMGNFLCYNPRKSLSCAPTGAIRLDGITGSGKGPYYFEIIDAPQRYIDSLAVQGKTLPDTILVKLDDGLPAGQTFEGFPAGNYDIRFTDGCITPIIRTATVEQLSADFILNIPGYPDWFGPNFISPSALGSESQIQPTDRHLGFFFRNSNYVGINDEFYEYTRQLYKFYEYAVLMPGETPETLSEDRWLEPPSSQDGYTSRIFVWESPDHTLAEMRGNTAWQPIGIALRPKNAASGCFVFYPTTWYPYDSWGVWYLQGGGDCTSKKIEWDAFNFGDWSTSLYAFPCSWEIREVAPDTIVEQSAGATITCIHMNSNSPNYFRHPNYRFKNGEMYKIIITDSQGYSRNYTFTVPINENDMNYSNWTPSVNEPKCTYNEFWYPAISAGASSSAAKATVKYIGASTSGWDPTWTPGGADDVTNLALAPPQATFTTPADYTGQYIWLYDANPCPTGDNVYDSDTHRWLNCKTETPYGVYLHFDVTDSCGYTRRIILNNGWPYREYSYNLNPKDELDIIDNCGVIEITMPNIADLMKYDEYANGFNAPTERSTNAHLRIKPQTDCFEITQRIERIDCGAPGECVEYIMSLVADGHPEYNYSYTYHFEFNPSGECIKASISFEYAAYPEYGFSEEYDDPEIIADFDIPSLIANLDEMVAIGSETATECVENPLESVHYSFNDSDGKGFCRTATDKIYITQPGKYVIQTVWEYRNDYSYFYDEYCLREDTIDIVIPPFQMDRNTSAAYRCPTVDGQGTATTGYIQVKPMNGSGSYLYELFTPDNLTVPIDTKIGGVNDGWFDLNDPAGPLSNTSLDTLVMRVTDDVCRRSFREKIKLYDLNNASTLWIEGSARKCKGDDLYLHGMSLGDGTAYAWTFPDNSTSNAQNPVITALTLAQSGWYYLEVTLPGCPGVTKRDSIKISVADKLMYWNPNAADNNWHNSANWLLRTGDTDIDYNVSASIPAPCTTVHIAGNARHYPSLDMEGTPRTIGTDIVGLPACDTIIYHYGSETYYPHYLRYARAKVQYNFRYYSSEPDGTGAEQPAANNSRDYVDGPFHYPNTGSGEAAPLPSMNRNRWYMLSLPLKNMTGGDFSLAGKPMTYQRLYNATSPAKYIAYRDDFTRTFHNLAEDVSLHGYALSLLVADNYNFLGWNDHSSLQNGALKGVIELPFYMDGNQALMDAHLQAYDAGTSTSAFEYFKWKDDGFPSLPLSPTGVYDYKVRDYKGYRFIFENEQDTVSVENGAATFNLNMGEILAGGTTNRVMLGNPLMCHIDFDRIYANNSDVIEDGYWLVDGDTEAFNLYTTAMGDTPLNGVTRDIAPLQGFVVQVKTNRTRDYLKLPLEGANAVVSQHGWNYTLDGAKPALPKPRTAQAQTPATGRIDVIATTPLPAEIAGSAASDSIRTGTAILFGYGDANNAPKLVFPEGLANKAEVFAVSADGTSLNAQQVENSLPETVKIGVESQYTGEIALQFRFYGSLVEKATLYDKVLNIQIPVTDGSAYQFTHRAEHTESGCKGLDSERFELNPTYRKGSNMESDSYYLSASIQDGELHVLSSETLRTVEVVNAAGVLIHKAVGIGASSYGHALNIPSGVYMAKVILADGRTDTRKVIK